MHRAVEGAHPHVDPGEPAQRVGEAGHADRPVAGVGEEEHVGAQVVRVGVEERGEAGGADLLFALDQHLHVARQRAGGAQPGPHRGGVRDHARLVVGRAAPEQAAAGLAWFERIARPTIDEAGRLDIVVRVEQHGGRVGSVGPFADHVRMAVAHAQFADRVEAGRAQEVGDRRRARVHVGRVMRVGADAGDADQRFEVVPGGVEIVVDGADRGRGRVVEIRFGGAHGRSSSYHSGACLRAHAAGTVPPIMLSSASPSRSANMMWPSTATQIPSANQSCTNVAPVRVSIEK